MQTESHRSSHASKMFQFDSEEMWPGEWHAHWYAVSGTPELLLSDTDFRASAGLSLAVVWHVACFMSGHFPNFSLLCTFPCSWRYILCRKNSTCIAEKFGRDWEIACNQHNVFTQHDCMNHRPESGLQLHIVWITFEMLCWWSFLDPGVVLKSKVGSFASGNLASIVMFWLHGTFCLLLPLVGHPGGSIATVVSLATLETTQGNWCYLNRATENYSAVQLPRRRKEFPEMWEMVTHQ
jgi:hypothetical protein